MCRTLLTITRNGNDETQRDAVKHLLSNQLRNAIDKGNTDGFFVGGHGPNGEHNIRTFSARTSLEQILGLANTGAKVIHVHARKVSRGSLSQANIHGWNFQGWRCTHNGTMYLAEEFEKAESDSYNVFQTVFGDPEDEDAPILTLDEIIANLKTVFEEHMWVGTGTFTMTNADHTIVVSVNRDTQFTTVNGGDVLNIVSNPDVNKVLDDKLRMESRRRVPGTSMGKKKFKGPIVREVFTYNVPAPDDMNLAHASSFNEIVVIDNNALDIIEVHDIEPGPSFVELHEYADPNPKTD